MFSVKDRDRIRDRVLELAGSDPRIVSGAVVGSLALDQGDRCSDLDLTFAVIDGMPVLEVVDDWTRSLVAEFDAIHLFDMPSGASLYRVFLFRQDSRRLHSRCRMWYTTGGSAGYLVICDCSTKQEETR